MKFTLGGVRGSCPVAQPEYMNFGGETTAFLIEGAQGERILIDGGTGVRELGKTLMQSSGEKSAWLFMTHYHLDHVAGLPMLPMLYSEDWHLIMSAPDQNEVHMREIMARILDKPLWPLQIEDLQSNGEYHQLDGAVSAEPYVCGGIEVRWCPLNHPGGCTAYRFDEPSSGASLVIATDCEWGQATPEQKLHLEDLISKPSPVELLIMDGQYDDSEIDDHRGWGHSTWQETIERAQRMKVKRLLITHHDPAADDKKLEKLNQKIRKETPWAGLARQGVSFDLPAG